MFKMLAVLLFTGSSDHWLYVTQIKSGSIIILLKQY